MRHCGSVPKNKYNTDLSTVILITDRHYFDSTNGFCGAQASYKKEQGVYWIAEADFWSYRLWNFTAPDHHSFSLSGGDMYRRLRQDGSVIAYDKTKLLQYLYNKNPSAEILQEYLDTKSH
ncbi:hypothetical protein N7520_000898 [Penicillium odoratum]|uniref:uncharacterized protein n=1 Tax=Penicillium odoratum TaxID=1167516 RepID=UPI002547BBD0|nr:uncharacterized protein N7520_000898 [Penicillium odoratum]KAJ5777652.1 hypothetical protein N7520_000898 [Penicillium odoratum]